MENRLYLKKSEKGYQACKKEDAEYVTVSISEYNGYQKALRIIKDRSLQQINKAVADKNGYTVLKADFKKYSRNDSGEAWLITQRTPYSINIDLGTANMLILKDLKELYGYEDITFDIKTVLRVYREYIIGDGDRSRVQNEAFLDVLSILDKHNGKVSFKINRISRNLVAGVYEVSYWSTKI